MSEGGTSNGVCLVEDEDMALYKKDALNVVTFNYIYDLKTPNDVTFKPEMAHQIFGESESIFGYQSLSITLNYLHNSCKCYVDIKTSRKVKNNNIKADNILDTLGKWLPTNFTVSPEVFSEWYSIEDHEKMYGNVLEKFQDQERMHRFGMENVLATYKITENEIVDPSFKEFHSRFETFIVWFIDAASFIDLDDDKWLIYYVYEEFEHPVSKKTIRSPIGFCTVYRFFAYPNGIRARISQFFILPSHQRRGIGTKLYQTVVKVLRSMDEVVDVTVEEPTLAFQKIRDLDDCLMVHKELQRLKKEFSMFRPKQLMELGRSLKIGRKQCERVYDVLGCCYMIEKGPSHHEKFLQEIKQRLTDEVKKDSKPGKRFCNKERLSLALHMDRTPEVEMEFKKHLEDIEPSVKYLLKRLGKEAASD
ncbi:histone acetyltransferase type B catalytic subunit [Cylas formicarius]|uniref:histone acetyltransferase type B catalytic subunit n=1 Tax=Cylas formicarius TaxID=197179 RepID=UPI002958B593|nr:histone acetyltransferase type B catalytic subunit [Cylas formicarius]